MRRHGLLALLAGGGDHRAAAPTLLILDRRRRRCGAAAGTAVAHAIGGAAGCCAVLALQVVLDNIAALHLLGRHARLGHERLGQHRVRAGHRGLGAAAGQVHVQLALGGITCGGAGRRWRGRGHTVRDWTLSRTAGTQAVRAGSGTAGIRLGGLELAMPQGPEFLVRLVGLVHQRVGIVQRGSLQHALQHGHILHNLSLQMAAGGGLGRANW